MENPFFPCRFFARKSRPGVNLNARRCPAKESKFPHNTLGKTPVHARRARGQTHAATFAAMPNM
eukprot:12877441-Alexandrium_andersonii.AAC.1